jgi:hypothetical protein
MAAAQENRELVTGNDLSNSAVEEKSIKSAETSSSHSVQSSTSKVETRTESFVQSSSFTSSTTFSSTSSSESSQISSHHSASTNTALHDKQHPSSDDSTVISIMHESSPQKLSEGTNIDDFGQSQSSSNKPAPHDPQSLSDDSAVISILHEKSHQKPSEGANSDDLSQSQSQTSTSIANHSTASKDSSSDISDPKAIPENAIEDSSAEKTPTDEETRGSLASFSMLQDVPVLEETIFATDENSFASLNQPLNANAEEQSGGSDKKKYDKQNKGCCFCCVS